MKKSNTDLTTIEDILSFFKNYHISIEAFDYGGIDTLVRFFRRSADYRTRRSYYSIEFLLISVLMAKLAGNADTFVKFADYAEARKGFFVKMGLISEEMRTPSHDTYRRFFMLFDKEFFRKQFQVGLNLLLSKIGKIAGIDDLALIQLCLDGQEHNGSGLSASSRKPRRNLGVLNMYNTATGVNLRSEVIDEKTNEIPVFDEFLRGMRLNGVLISADALHCQRKHCETIARKGGYYLFGLKENQKDLYGLARKVFENRNEGSHTFERVETKKRTVDVALFKEPGEDGWDSLTAFVRMVSHIRKDSADNERLFITNLPSKDLIAKAIGNRWQIENNLHKFTDQRLNQDAFRSKDRRANDNLHVMNALTVSFYKLCRLLFGMRSNNVVMYSFMYKPLEMLSALVNVLRNRGRKALEILRKRKGEMQEGKEKKA